jgi:hypothetical protein
VAAPFIVAAPGGARVRTRLRVSGCDAAVLREAGTHLGSLAGRDLAARCREGGLDAQGRARSRAVRKRALTAESSSRWAGSITRTSEDQVQAAVRNLRAQRATLIARIRAIEKRLPVPAGGNRGRGAGYATAAERHAKQVRVQVLRARLDRAGRQLAGGEVPVVRGGRGLLRKRGHLAQAGLTEERWRAQWQAARLFLTADGEKGKPLGNETIRWHPGERWAEIKLPAPLAGLGNRPHGRYRLCGQAGFAYRGDEVAAQAATGAVRYDISYDPAKDRWYLDASWRTGPAPAGQLDGLRERPVLAVDLNHGHLAAWLITADGNAAGPPVTVPLELAGLPAATRDGRLRAAITTLISLASQHGCRAIAVEDLDFAAARAQGREHWLAPLREQHPDASGHHAAAVVIGRRALGFGARRREGVTGGGQRASCRGAASRTPRAKRASRNGRPRQAQRPPPRRWRKTATAQRPRPPDQAAQDRPGPPDSQDHLLLSQSGTVSAPRRPGAASSSSRGAP